MSALNFALGARHFWRMAGLSLKATVTFVIDACQPVFSKLSVDTGSGGQFVRNTQWKDLLRLTLLRIFISTSERVELLKQMQVARLYHLARSQYFHPPPHGALAGQPDTVQWRTRYNWSIH